MTMTNEPRLDWNECRVTAESGGHGEARLSIPFATAPVSERYAEHLAEVLPAALESDTNTLLEAFADQNGVILTFASVSGMVGWRGADTRDLTNRMVETVWHEYAVGLERDRSAIAAWLSAVLGHTPNPGQISLT